MAEEMIDSHSIVAAMFTRYDGTFHWSLALPGAGAGGQALKIHAIDPGQFWRFDVSDQDLIHSARLCVVLKIGSRRTPTRTFDPAEVRDLLQEIPMATPVFELSSVQRFTCRVWFRQADLEDELLGLATANAQNIFSGTVPCSYRISKTCSWANKRFPPLTI
ncbi:hypothetical protein IEO21_08169 [Rhodonia placenta]|uniref:Uncharacterized protein n=1 Tax=Rhodonia placenta TaxID=104341 RepID=A0A8H7NWR5_9APHY|nr:hypothetical protein IEO21_08169 [Postia placenta]